VHSESLIRWSEPLLHLAEFVGVFLAAGAVGFRYSALRGRPGAEFAVPTDAGLYDDAARRAAVLGLVGALIGAWQLATALPRLAARRHVSVPELLRGTPVNTAWLALAVLAILGFVLARVGSVGLRRVGWQLAALGVVGGTLRNALAGQWSRLVNPIHILAAGLWIGTLFMLLTAGIPAVLRDEPARERRGAIVADLVNGFSPLALVCGLVVVLFGVITAWRHLGAFDALWTTPYGWTLLGKLAVVAGVFALGAWNWRRQRPLLGSEAAAHAIRRSAAAELAVAGLVLLITAVLVSLPAPAEMLKH
jgi:putative copper export protein